jgi:hypothetical protein
MSVAIIPPYNSGGGGSVTARSILYGNGAPASSLGSDGDSYIDKQNPSIYGPKAGGVWPAPIALSGDDSATAVLDSISYVAQTDGAQTISIPIQDPKHLELYHNGILQPENTYTVTGNTVSVKATLDVKATDILEVVYEYLTNAGSGGGSGSSNSYTNEIPTGNIDGSNKTFNLTYFSLPGTLSLYVNGVLQDEEDFTINGKAITFNTAPTKKVRALYFR